VSRLFPSFTFGDEYFFRADGCPPEVAAKRQAGFDRLCSTWAKKWPKSKVWPSFSLYIILFSFFFACFRTADNPPERRQMGVTTDMH